LDFFTKAYRMDIRARTALISTGLNALLTAAKFVLYFFTGSLAILAEAWHSLSDIATSLLVYISVRARPADQSSPGSHDDSVSPPPDGSLTGATEDGSSENPERASDENRGKRTKRARSLFDAFMAYPLEQRVSLGIGIFLAGVALALVRRFLAAEAIELRLPLLSGLLFIAFSLGSYFVYRFETEVGRSEGSVGLIADGMHSKSDMVSSLLAGFSLILYHLGLDIDRWVAGLIALFILSFGIETIANVRLARYRDAPDLLFRYKSYTAIASLFDKEAIARAADAVDDGFAGRMAGSSRLRRTPRTLAALLLVASALVYGSTAFYTVGPSEEAIVERFGRPVNVGEPIQPGLHLKYPWPIDRAIRIDTHTIRQMNIGNITDASSFALLWTRQHGTEVPFLTADNYYFYPYLVLHYQVCEIFDYRYRFSDSEALLNGLAHRVITHLFAGRTFNEIVISYRSRMAEDVLTLIQAELDGLQSGIEIITVNIKDIHPPIFIADSFEKVIEALQYKQKLINDAHGYRNKNIPEARGKAARDVESARAFVVGRVLRAEGEAERFVARRLSEHDRKVGIRRLYLDGMLDVLTNRPKILIDPAVAPSKVWLDFDRLTFPEGMIMEKLQTTATTTIGASKR